MSGDEIAELTSYARETWEARRDTCYECGECLDECACLDSERCQFCRSLETCDCEAENA